MAEGKRKGPSEEVIKTFFEFESTNTIISTAITQLCFEASTPTLSRIVSCFTCLHTNIMYIITCKRNMHSSTRTFGVNKNGGEYLILQNLEKCVFAKEEIETNKAKLHFF